MEKSYAELLKEELMERYGLRPDQIRMQVTISTTDLALGREILSDYDRHGETDHLPEFKNCDMVYGNIIDLMYIHRKDGFYGQYVYGEDEEQ